MLPLSIRLFDAGKKYKRGGEAGGVGASWRGGGKLAGWGQAAPSPVWGLLDFHRKYLFPYRTP